MVTFDSSERFFKMQIMTFQPFNLDSLPHKKYQNDVNSLYKKCVQDIVTVFINDLIDIIHTYI